MVRILIPMQICDRNRTNFEILHGCLGFSTKFKFSSDFQVLAVTWKRIGPKPLYREFAYPKPTEVYYNLLLQAGFLIKD